MKVLNFLISLMISNVSSFGIIEQGSKISDMTKVIVEIIKTHDFGADPTVTITNWINSDESLYWKSMDTIEEISNAIKNNLSVQTFGASDFKDRFDINGLVRNEAKKPRKFFNIIFLTRKEDGTLHQHQTALFHKNYNYFYHTEGKAMIVALEKKPTNRHEQFQRDLKNFLDIGVENVVFLDEINSKINIYAGFPYQSGKCGQTEVKLINTYENSSFSEEKVFFTDKLKTLNNCTLKIAAEVKPPFMFPLKDEISEDKYTGIDLKLINELHKIWNFLPEYHMKNGTFAFTEILYNLKYSEPPALTYDFMSGIPLNFELKKMLFKGPLQSQIVRGDEFKSPKASYYTSRYVLQIPHGRPLTFVEKLYKPFDFVFWMTILGFSTLLLVTVIVVRKFLRVKFQKFILGSKMTTPFMNIVSLTLTGSIPGEQLPLRNFARYVVALLILYFMIIQSAYTGVLFDFIQKDMRTETAQTVQELIDQNYTFFIKLEEKETFLNISWNGLFERQKPIYNETEYQEIIKKLRTYTPEKIARLASLDELLFENLEFGGKLNNYCPEIVLSVPRKFTMKYPSMLEHKLEEILLQLQENGFVNKLLDEYIPKHDFQEEDEDNVAQVLTVFSIYEIGYLVAGGWLLGFLAFIVEKYSKLFRKIARKFSRRNYES